MIKANHGLQDCTDRITDYRIALISRMKVSQITQKGSRITLITRIFFINMLSSALHSPLYAPII